MAIYCQGGPGLEIIIKIDDIDYGAFVERYYPLVKDRIQGGDGMVARMMATLADVPPEKIRSVVNILPKGTKDELAIRLLNANKDKLLNKARKLLEEQDLNVTISDVEVRR